MKDAEIKIRISKKRKNLFMEAAKEMDTTATEILNKKIQYTINKRKAVVDPG